MSVRFVIGRCGTGKTWYCFSKIVEAMRAEPLGPAIFWILPKQATFQAERELTVNSGLAGFARCRVVSFDQLGRDVLQECGGGAVAEITTLGRQMLLGHLLRKFQDRLVFFKGVARQPGLAARLDATFTEFDRCGKDATELERIRDEVVAAGSEDLEQQLLAQKLSDFVLLHRAYHEFLGAERVDPHRRLEKVLACVHESKRLRGARVYVDGFLEFTDSEMRVLAAMGAAADGVEITLLADPASKTIKNVHHLPDEMGLFFRLEETYRRLVHVFNQAGAKIETPVTLGENQRAKRDALRVIESSLFAGQSLSHGQDATRLSSSKSRATGVELVEAADRRGEVNAVARRIGELLRARHRLRDVAVLCRDLGEYDELISASFREHGIPFFADRRRSATHHPLLVFTRAVFEIARAEWPGDAVMGLAKSGLAQMSADEADELENYVLLHRIRSGAWEDAKPWTYARTIRRDEDDEPFRVEREQARRMDEVRRKLVDLLAPFLKVLQKPATVRQIVTALFELYQRFEVTRTLSLWMEQATAANKHEQRGEHEQVWAELVELFDQLVDLLGDQTVELSDFVQTLESGLEQFDLALTPPTVDQVLVGQVDRTRSVEAKAVFVLGMAEGQFPRVAREDSVLSDAERRALVARSLNVQPDSERKLLDENLYGYLAFTRASETLVLTRAVADAKGNEIAPSVFWERVRGMFPDVVTQQRKESEAEAEDVATPRQLVTGLMRWAREDRERDAGSPPAARDPAATESWPALYQWLATHECCDDAIDVMRYRAWKALSYHNRAELSAQVAGKLFGSPLKASVTRIETFATCPFKHFAQFGLNLRPCEEQDVTAMDLGNVYHQILERLVRECLVNRQDWCEIQPKVSEEMIKEYSAEVGRSLRGELMLSTARNQYLLKRIEKTLKQVVAAQRETLRRGEFRPAWAELAFGGKDALLPPHTVNTPRGNVVELQGKIDRVDLIESEAAFAVIDYKLTGRPLALDRVYHGLSLQLLTYLLVLSSSGEKLHGRKLTPVAAFYAQLLRKLERVKHPDDGASPDDPKFDLRVKPRGIFDARYVRKLDGELVDGRSQVVAAQIKKDGELGDRNKTDVASPDEFAALLRFVEHKIAQLADQIIAGDIGVTPYRIARQSPCEWCDFRSVCRFDVSVNHYHHMAAMKRTEVLDRVVEEVGGHGSD